MKRILLASILVIGAPAFGAEPETVIVTANRIETPQDEVATSFTVIDHKKIVESGKAQVADVLRDVPGLTVTNQGGAGHNTTIFLRGAKGYHTLVLIDGVVVNDPLNPNGAYDFGNLSTENIERIEVLRGPQSVLYGSSAMGGVINIITRKGAGGALGGAADIEYGAYRTVKTSAEVHGGDKAANYSLAAGFFDTDGFSVADKNLGNVESDPYRRATGSLRLGFEPVEKLDVSLVSRLTDGELALDSTGGAPGTDAFGSHTGDDTNYTGRSLEFSSKLEVRSRHFSIWQPKLSLGYFLNHRTTQNLPDLVNPATENTLFHSFRIKPEFQNDFLIDDSNTVVAGIDAQMEKGTTNTDYGFGIAENTYKDSIHGEYLEHRYGTDAFFSSEGVRWDHHEIFGSHATYRLAPGYRFQATGTTLKATLGTGFRAPSLFELFDPTFGNTALRPETSVGWDAGFEQAFSDNRFSVGASYFRNDLDNLIDFAASHYINSGKATTQGVELTGRASITRDLTANANYTYTATRNDTTGDRLLRIPYHQANVDLGYRLTDLADASFGGRFVGSRRDADAVTAATVDMPAYAVFRLGAGYHLKSDLKITARIENIFDRQYEEVNGFGTEGRSLYFGLRKDL